uniref:Uncharacterized protein n=1 Tax=Oryza punctata TaxID=4537 RepID=A0A0E0M5N9_ORYPU
MEAESKRVDIECTVLSDALKKAKASVKALKAKWGKQNQQVFLLKAAQATAPLATSSLAQTQGSAKQANHVLRLALDWLGASPRAFPAEDAPPVEFTEWSSSAGIGRSDHQRGRCARIAAGLVLALLGANGSEHVTDLPQMLKANSGEISTMFGPNYLPFAGCSRFSKVARSLGSAFMLNWRSRQRPKMNSSEPS